MATKKTTKKKEAPKTEFTASDIEGFTHIVNRFHGAGAQSGVAFSLTDPSHPVIGGLVTHDADLPGYVVIPTRDRIDGQYTPAEVKEIVDAA